MDDCLHRGPLGSFGDRPESRVLVLNLDSQVLVDSYAEARDPG